MEIKGIDGFGLKEYKHYPRSKALKEIETGQDEIYKVTTINLTYATNHREGAEQVVGYDRLHKNIYHVALKDFVEWCSNFMEVSEEIISVEKIGRFGKGRSEE